MPDHDISRVPLQLVQGCVVASIQIELAEAVLEQFRNDLLLMLQRTNATGVVLDVSGIEVMDLEEFDALRQTMQMAGLMGARTIFSGFRAGVVSSLVELDANLCSIEAALNLDVALDALIIKPEENADHKGDTSDEPGAATASLEAESLDD